MRILKDLFEGLEMKDHPEGGKVIHYYDDPNHQDDPRLSKITSTKHKGYVQTKGAENPVIGGPTSSYEEERELKHAIKNNPGALQNKIPAYFGFVMEPAPEKADTAFNNSKINITDKDKNTIRKYSQPFQDALKGKDNTEGVRFDPESKQKLIDKGSSNIVHQMNTHGKHGINLRLYDQIFVVPMPSSAALSKDFAASLTKELKSQGLNATMSSDLVKKKRFPKISLIRSMQENVGGISKHEMMPRNSIDYRYGNDEKQVLAKMYNAPLRLKNASEEEIRHNVHNQFNIARQRIADIDKRLNSNTLNPRDKFRLNNAKIAFKDMIADEPRITKLMNMSIAREKKKGWSGQQENKRLSSIASEFGTRRHSIRDFTKHDPNHPHTNAMFDPSKKTLVILSDDNVDTGATTDDFYRGLFKEGMVHKNMDFVTAALHKRGTGGRTGKYATDLHSQHQQHTGKISPRGRKPLTPKKPKVSAPKKHNYYQIAKDQFNDWKNDPDYKDMRNDIVDDMVDSHGISREEADKALKQVEGEHETDKNQPPTEEEAMDVMKHKIGGKADKLVDKRNDKMISNGFDPTFTKEKLFKNAAKIMSQYIDAGHSKDDATKETLKRFGIKESITFINCLING